MPFFCLFGRFLFVNLYLLACCSEITHHFILNRKRACQDYWLKFLRVRRATKANNYLDGLPRLLFSYLRALFSPSKFSLLWSLKRRPRKGCGLAKLELRTSGLCVCKLGTYGKIYVLPHSHKVAIMVHHGGCTDPVCMAGSHFACLNRALQSPSLLPNSSPDVQFFPKHFGLQL